MWYIGLKPWTQLQKSRQVHNKHTAVLPVKLCVETCYFRHLCKQGLQPSNLGFVFHLLIACSPQTLFNAKTWQHYSTHATAVVYRWLTILVRNTYTT